MSSSEKRKSGKIAFGRKYEKLAALFYEQKGFELLERNWRTGHKEIDLIVRKDNLLVFVEVKAVRTKSFGHPAEKVDQKKQQRLIEAAQKYLITQNIEGCTLRFDVITFVDGKLEHYPDAIRVDE